MICQSGLCSRASLGRVEASTRPMIVEGLSAGCDDSTGWNRDSQTIQMRTIEELLKGRKFDMP